MAGRRGRGGGGGGGKGGAGAKTCNKCHKVGHIAANCRSSGNTFKCTNCNMNNHATADCTKGKKKGEKHVTSSLGTTVSKRKVSRPCRFCKDMHLDKDCPTKGGSGSIIAHTYGDTHMRDVFGVPEFSPPCHYCGGQHLSTNCPKLVHQPADQYQYQRYPAQLAPVAPVMNLWDACDDIREEFVTGEPWYDATRYGQVDNNSFPTFYTLAVSAEVYLEQNQRRDIDGDCIMTM
ncbi:hypothetical protein BKA65DRAFT_555745 [Rhexocercosporidium sp. MPI-PUGE-AT-0058]|nr:hypothetical protein BKA65DRAFT_555745 [Rhexocercosporidium sp. MPI-PUGE-AT-0058]